jgi:hypothetical protein
VRKAFVGEAMLMDGEGLDRQEWVYNNTLPLICPIVTQLQTSGYHYRIMLKSSPCSIDFSDAFIVEGHLSVASCKEGFGKVLFSWSCASQKLTT